MHESDDDAIADGPAPSDDPHVVVMHDVFDWLGYLQESLVQTLD